MRRIVFGVALALAASSPTLASDKSGTAPPDGSARAYIDVLAGMIETGLKQRCGTELLGQLVFMVPLMVSTGSQGDQEAQGAWAKKNFSRLSKLPSPEGLPKVVDTADCRALQGRLEALAAEPAFNRLAEEGMLAMVKKAKEAEGQPATR